MVLFSLLNVPLAAILTSTAAASAAVVNSNQLFDKADAAPRDWSLIKYASPDESIRLEVSLQEQNYDAFSQLVMDMSTPDHDKYGQHLEGHEVDDMLRPHDDAYQAVHQWLEANDVDSHLVDDDSITFLTNVSNAERMLSTRFAWYKHDSDGREVLRTDAYSLPANLVPHVSYLHPTIKFPSIRPLRSMIAPVHQDTIAAVNSFLKWQSSNIAIASSSSPAAAVAPPDAVCNSTITPQCLLKLYNVHYGAQASGNSFAFASFLDQYARYSDLSTFETTQATYASGRNFSVTQFNGGGNDQDSKKSSIEANLDCQYAVGVAHPVPVLEYSTAGCGPLVPDQGSPAGSCNNEPYARFLKSLLAQPNSALPQTLSVSYGESEQTWPPAMAQKICSQLARLAARGVSVLFASGDSGPGGPGDICENNAGTARQYVPAFPASCPFITVVGATRNIPERATSFSGGGFSNYFAQPSYQKTAVSSYLANAPSQYKQYYNQSGRAYPDVAAQGSRFVVVDKGRTIGVGGTSASAPTFASIVALLNAARKASGKAPLGFLNPMLYSSSGVAALNDITLGGSTSCDGGDLTIPGGGFAAVTGWDPVTGLGTPDFGKLLAFLAPGVANTGGVLAA